MWSLGMVLIYLILVGTDFYLISKLALVFHYPFLPRVHRILHFFFLLIHSQEGSLWASESENNHVQKIFLKVLSLVKGVQGK